MERVCFELRVRADRLDEYRERQSCHRVLFGVTAACIVLGALIGWAAGSLAYGLVFGAVIGIPAGVAATILRYRDM